MPIQSKGLFLRSCRNTWLYAQLNSFLRSWRNVSLLMKFFCLLSFNKRMNVMRVNCVNFSFLLVSLVWRPNDCHYTSYSHYIQYFHIFPTFEHARWGGRSTLTLSSLSLFFAVPTFPRSLIFLKWLINFKFYNRLFFLLNFKTQGLRNWVPFTPLFI